MLKSYFQRWFADPKGTAALVRRLLLEQAAGQWRRYALAFALMAIAAASTALGAYLIGDVINQAYVHKNLPGIIMLAHHHGNRVPHCYERWRNHRLICNDGFLHALDIRE